jgi:hypothetical protein
MNVPRGIMAARNPVIHWWFVRTVVPGLLNKATSSPDMLSIGWRRG